MAVRYKVTVTRIETDIPFNDKEYKEVGKNEAGEKVYDYVWFESKKTEQNTIYEQQVDELNLVDVINAVNAQ